MNSMLLAVFVAAGSLFFVHREMTSSTPSLHYPTPDTISIQALIGEDVAWDTRGVQWLLEAQAPNGGWGAGSHSYQNVRDPHAVQTDPATTAFAAQALLRAGGAWDQNPYQKQILKALDRMLSDIEKRPDNGRITSLTGTQPQVKLGINIDASMALQFLTAMRDHVTDADAEKRIDHAAAICIHLIQQSQDTNGGWAGGGWAPVLQSAMANNALEIAQDRYTVDTTVLNNSRRYQAGQVSPGGSADTEDAAGIPLYAVASAQRATKKDADELMRLVQNAPIGEMSTKESERRVRDELLAKGISDSRATQLVEAYKANTASQKALRNEAIWDGFGNNGGEEYLSYLLTSESLAQGDKGEWEKWRNNIGQKFQSSQNPNGSWSGHHCITSPVFCTAAIIQAWHAGDAAK